MLTEQSYRLSVSGNFLRQQAVRSLRSRVKKNEQISRRQAAQRMDSRDQNDNATRVPFYLNLFSASGGAGRRALLNDTDDLGTSCASFSFLRRTCPVYCSCFESQDTR